MRLALACQVRRVGCDYEEWGVADVLFMAAVTITCAKRTGTAASVERRRRERLARAGRAGKLAGVTLELQPGL